MVKVGDIVKCKSASDRYYANKPYTGCLYKVLEINEDDEWVLMECINPPHTNAWGKVRNTFLLIDFDSNISKAYLANNGEEAWL